MEKKRINDEFYFEILKSCCTKSVVKLGYYIEYVGITCFMVEKNNSVNIFRKYNYCITCYASAYYKTYCFAFQKRLFCTVKA